MPRTIHRSSRAIQTGDETFAGVGTSKPTSGPVGELFLDESEAGADASLATLTVTADVTLTAAHTFIRCDCAAGDIIVTLPSVVDHEGRRFFIKKIDPTSNTVTIDGDGTDTIDLALTAVLTDQFEQVPVIGDATVLNWDIF